MRNLINFLNNYYEKAIKLSNDFSSTRSLDWSPLIILNELSIQIGHIYNVVYKNDIVNEKERDFNNLGDELSDVVLQLIALSESLKIDMLEIEKTEMFKENDWLSLPILFGQLNEAIMEKEGYRFNKPRKGFVNIDEFIKSRIFKLFIITFNIASKYKLNLEEEFELMLEDANKFLSRFNKNLEYINVYDDIHNFKGVVEKRKAHKLGLWHETTNVIIFNPTTKNIFFRKNENEDLDLTVVRHLNAGEDYNDTVNKIKEETGLEVSYEDLILYKTRKINMENSTLTREFQNFYLLPLDINLNKFKSSNKYVQVNLNDVLNLLIFNYGIQSEIKIKNRNKITNIDLKREDFNSTLLNNGILQDSLNKIEEYINIRLTKLKLDKAINKKLNKIFRFIKLDKLIHNKKYYNDNGRTEKILDIYKDNITYTLVKNNIDIKTNNYIVFLIISLDNKTATKQLINNFNNKKEAEKYFKYLSDYINSNSNEDIINYCYKNLKETTDKNLIARLLTIID